MDSILVVTEDTVTFTITMSEDTWNRVATPEDVIAVLAFARGERRGRLVNLIKMLQSMEGDNDCHLCKDSTTN